MILDAEEAANRRQAKYIWIDTNGICDPTDCEGCQQIYEETDGKYTSCDRCLEYVEFLIERALAHWPKATVIVSSPADKYNDVPAHERGAPEFREIPTRWYVDSWNYV